MSHTLQLDVPDDVYAELVRRTEEAGRSPEAMATDWLATTVQTSSASNDPLNAFIGAFESTSPGAADEHDRHLGSALTDELNTDDSDG